MSVYDFFLQFRGKQVVHLEVLDIDEKDFKLALKLWREKKIGEDANEPKGND